MLWIHNTENIDEGFLPMYMVYADPIRVICMYKVMNVSPANLQCLGSGVRWV